MFSPHFVLSGLFYNFLIYRFKIKLIWEHGYIDFNRQPDWFNYFYLLTNLWNKLKYIAFGEPIF